MTLGMGYNEIYCLSKYMYIHIILLFHIFPTLIYVNYVF